MTKNEMIREVLHMDLNSIYNRLAALVEENRITVGAAYYVYNPYDFYGYKKILEIFDRACKSKNYNQYLNCNVPKWNVQYYYSDLLSQMDRAKKFIEEQESLPFEQTQKQILIQKGELS